ncbi:hypothetical protein LTR85_007832 [Meristemomyces frigidus]|nr:hypothetical protein LTR85_007832 [Meristemomyces frigidus]
MCQNCLKKRNPGVFGPFRSRVARKSAPVLRRHYADSDSEDGCANLRILFNGAASNDGADESSDESDGGSESDAGGDGPGGGRKDSGRSSSPKEPCSEAGRIEQLEAQLLEADKVLFLHGYPEGLKWYTPESIESRMGSRITARHDQILTSITLTYKVGKSMCMTKPRGEAADDVDTPPEEVLSAAMLRFLPHVCELAKLPGPKAIDTAIDLIIELTVLSHAIPDGQAASSTVHRPSDYPADLLLRRLLKKKLANDIYQVKDEDGWDDKLLDRLRGTAADMDKRGVPTIFGRSIARLERWLKEKGPRKW